MHKLSTKLLLALSLAAGVAPWAAADEGNARIVDGVAIYLGLLPAELIAGHPAGHAEADMHPEARGQREHLVVALFDAVSGERITDAEVSASIHEEAGGHARPKRLQAMEIADTVTYGNFFELPAGREYRIRLQVRRPGDSGVIEAEFEHVHGPD